MNIKKHILRFNGLKFSKSQIFNNEILHTKCNIFHIDVLKNLLLGMSLITSHGERIALFRKFLRLDIATFAKHIGISPRTQSDRENNKSSATHKELVRMVEMGANPEFLLTGKGLILREGFKRGS